MTDTAPTIVQLDPRELVEWKNYRTRYGSLESLTASLREHGMLHPVTVRPAVTGHEIALGHRRVRASVAAGLETIPCVVRELSDEQIVEMQLVENLEREDVHPIDDAVALQGLRDVMGWDIEEIALRIGRSKTFVYGRLRLLSLSPKAMQLIEDGKLPLRYATLLAGLEEHAAHDRCLEELHDWHGEFELIPFDDWRYVVGNQTRNLDRAPFDVADATLVPLAGACASCPYRTHAQHGLFAGMGAESDDEGADCCTRSGCWEQKIEAHRERELATFREEHGEDLPTIEAPHHYGDAPVQVASGKSNTLGAGVWLTGGRYSTWAELIPEDQRPAPVAIATPKGNSGVPALVYAVEDLKKAARAAGARLAKRQSSGTESVEAKKRADEGKRWRGVAIAMLDAIPEGLDGVGLGDLWPVVARLAVRRASHEALKFAAGRRDLERRKVDHGTWKNDEPWDETFERWIVDATVRDLQALVLELLALGYGLQAGGDEGVSDRLRSVATLIGFDVDEQYAAATKRAMAAGRKATKKPSKRGASKKAARKNPWAGLSEDERLARINQIREARDLPPRESL